jgi:formate hydrogenlyase subunit 3/multisubunit Na+/H+ antiporter MnhD subunit
MPTEVLALIMALPLAGSIVAVGWPERGRFITLATGLATALVVLYVLWQVARVGVLIQAPGGWARGLGVSLRVDALSALLLTLTAGVALAGGVYAADYFRPRTARHFWPLWMLLWTALNALLTAGDLFNIYVTLELVGLAAVSLAALGGSRAAVDAALRYLMVGLMGSMAYLLGVALLYLSYGSLDLMTVSSDLRPEPTALAACGLMTGGLLLKTALFPLHFWLPPAHANAPAPVSAALSALVVKAGFYLVMRLWLELFPAILTPGATLLLGALGAGAVLWGSWQALQAQRLKLLAAYSTVAQLGYLFLGLSLCFDLSGGARRELLGGLVMLALTHGFAKAGLFMAIGVVQQREGHDRIAGLAGTVQRLPLTVFSIGLAGVALIGLPPSGAFVGKWLLLAGAFDAGRWLWVVVIAAGSLLACAYVFRALAATFAGTALKPGAAVIGREEWPPLIASALGALVLGAGGWWIWPLLAGPQ